METRKPVWRRNLAALLACAFVGSMAAPALADQYDPLEAGHPLRVAAYVLHPVGVALDLLIFRPAHWLGGQPGLARLFGHETYRD
jgi:hypothetical protein